MLSEIQIQILGTLLKSNGLRYSEAYPGEEIDDDLYNYHLQFLVKRGLVEKKEGRYFLTDEGKKTVQQIDSKGNLKELFKVSVVVYITRENEGRKEILLSKRIRHPYLGDILTVSGKVHPGEKYIEAGKRKLKEETELEAKLRFVGGFRTIRRDNTGKLFEDTVYNVCVGKNPSGKLIEKNEFGENFWASFKEAIRLQKKNVTASEVKEKIYKKVRDEELEPFYFEEELKLARV